MEIIENNFFTSEKNDLLRRELILKSVDENL